MNSKLKIVFHIHSWVSADASWTKQTFINSYQKTDYDYLVICDHQEILGAQIAGQELDKKIIVGEEVETLDCDIIGLFLISKIPSGLSIEQTIQEIKHQGGLVYLPHPFDRLRKNTIHLSKLEKIVDGIDIVEVFNSRTVFKADNHRAKKFAQKFHKIQVCGNDSHTKFEVNRAYMEIDDFFDQKSFLRSLRTGEMILKSSPIFIHLITKLKKFSNAKV